MNIAAKLNEAVKAVCPIHGVSIGRKDDKQTWRIDFKDEATTQERTAAQIVVDAFDVVAAEAPDPRIVLDEQEQASAKLDNQINTFLNFTPAQRDAWITNNISNAATLAELKVACTTAFSVLGALATHASRGKPLR